MESLAADFAALATSSQYPCVAAGLCPVIDNVTDITCSFNWRSLSCTPVEACARKFPALRNHTDKAE